MSFLNFSFEKIYFKRVRVVQDSYCALWHLEVSNSKWLGWKRLDSFESESWARCEADKLLKTGYYVVKYYSITIGQAVEVQSGTD